MRQSQKMNHHMDNELIHLFVHRAVKRSVEASKAGTVDNFFRVMIEVTMRMLPGDEDWQGVYPETRLNDDFDEFERLIEQSENHLLARNDFSTVST